MKDECKEAFVVFDNEGLGVKIYTFFHQAMLLVTLN